ncbi:MAG: D-sedoheptulose 7-phosphate isomerase [Bacteroidetes bacterium]|jgi:phosphoheptose isomerase (EC 5.3.1.-)|uniref:D-sedoheptulose-7-phosphate isomerase n=1 Tax=Phnomibacter sp. TaxID=2836217 RepID=UPI002FDED778|nr:D-sedoheptulose 7-phosphate isomerase [Bacteroidota bacterium]
MQSTIQQIFQSSIDAKQQLLASERLLQLTETVSVLITEAFRNSHRLYFCGNGGSAADAQHLAAEFTGAFYNRNRPALPAEALHVNTSYITAAANDYDYNSIYSRLVEGIMQPGDVLVGLSTSGNSGNVVKAFEAARAKGITTVGMTGEKGGALRPLSDYLFDVPSNDTPRIQECHMLIGHTICQLVEAQIFPA